ncbi:AP2-ERF domain [Babesia duncani]|uniref:AP2-ERF domain n=1 Tax=Babesia duncani TaxID=323732 RepID=A0AAD9PLP9_9APIC|nr:AP2-ERF domain [Babesia duncani]
MGHDSLIRSLSNISIDNVVSDSFIDPPHANDVDDLLNCIQAWQMAKAYDNGVANENETRSEYIPPIKTLKELIDESTSENEFINASRVNSFRNLARQHGIKVDFDKVEKVMDRSLELDLLLKFDCQCRHEDDLTLDGRSTHLKWKDHNVPSIGLMNRMYSGTLPFLAATRSFARFGSIDSDVTDRASESEINPLLYDESFEAKPLSPVLITAEDITPYILIAPNSVADSGIIQSVTTSVQMDSMRRQAQMESDEHMTRKRGKVGAAKKQQATKSKHVPRVASTPKRDKGMTPDGLAKIRNLHLFPKIKGVCYCSSDASWTAWWTEKGRNRKKAYKMSIYGFDEARRLAIERRQMAEEMYPHLFERSRGFRATGMTATEYMQKIEDGTQVDPTIVAESENVETCTLPIYSVEENPKNSHVTRESSNTSANSEQTNYQQDDSPILIEDVEVEGVLKNVDEQVQVNHKNVEEVQEILKDDIVISSIPDPIIPQTGHESSFPYIKHEKRSNLEITPAANKIVPAIDSSNRGTGSFPIILDFKLLSSGLTKALPLGLAERLTSTTQEADVIERSIFALSNRQLNTRLEHLHSSINQSGLDTAFTNPETGEDGDRVYKKRTLNFT